MDRKKVFECKSKWDTSVVEQVDKAIHMQEFNYENDQWDAQLKGARLRSGAESLTINVLGKMILTVKSKFKNIELILDAIPKDNMQDMSKDEINQYNTLVDILKEIQLNSKAVNSFSDSLDNCIDRGMSAILVNIIEDENTLNPKISIENIREVDSFFFDVNATDPYYQTGAYCGICRKIDPKHLNKLYNLDTKCNSVIDIWYKKYKNYLYVATDKGYVREDKLTKNHKVLDEPKKKRTRPYIIFERYIKDNDKPLESFTWSSDCLPLVYNPTMSNFIYTKDGMKLCSAPYAYNCVDAQKMLNYVTSQVATLSKLASLIQWVGTNDNVSTKDARKSASMANNSAGLLLFDADQQGRLPTRLDPIAINPVLIELMTQVKQLIYDMTNAFMDVSNGSMKMMSGVALDRMFKRTDLMQSDTINTYIKFVNEVGKVVKSTIPYVYKYQFDMQIGNGKVTVNKQTLAGDVVNNISDINNVISDYTIKADIPQELDNQNNIESLIQLYQIAPEASKTTIDIFVKLLGGSISDVLSKRLEGIVDQNLIDYSNGKITKQELQEAMQKQAQQAQQQQLMQQQQLLQMQNQIEEQKLQLHAQKQQDQHSIAVQKLQLESQQIASQSELNQALADKDRADSMIDLAKLQSQEAISQQKLDMTEQKTQAEIEKAQLELAMSIDKHVSPKEKGENKDAD